MLGSQIVKHENKTNLSTFSLSLASLRWGFLESFSKLGMGTITSSMFSSSWNVLDKNKQDLMPFFFVKSIRSLPILIDPLKVRKSLKMNDIKFKNFIQIILFYFDLTFWIFLQWLDTKQLNKHVFVPASLFIIILLRPLKNIEKTHLPLIFRYIKDKFTSIELLKNKIIIFTLF